MVNPLNPLLSKITKYEDAEIEAQQWESKRVEWTLRRLGKEKERKELLADSGGGLYTFEGLNRVLPDFPVLLMSDRLQDLPPIHRDPRAIHPLWFKAFSKLPFVQRYIERCEELPEDGKPRGVVFPRKGFSQGLILHSGDWERFVPPGSSCHLFRGGSKSTIVLVVQPYMTFVDSIAKA